ncbi:MAG TPA: DNA translocase FtsK 4TM domain-containing protein, partial [Opitutaceae bacterium]
MAKSASSNSNVSPFKAPRYQPQWVIFSICLLLGLLMTVAFANYEPEQSVQITTHPTGKNLVGHFGAEMAFWSLHFIGIGTWLLPLFLLWMAYVSVRNARRLPTTRVVAMLIAIMAFSSLAAMFNFSKSLYFSEGLGGVLGNQLYDNVLADSLGVFGSGLLLAMVYAIALMFIFTRDIAAEFEKFAAHVNEWRENHAKAKAEKAELKAQLRAEKLRQKNAVPPMPVGAPGKKLSLTRNTN